MKFYLLQQRFHFYAGTVREYLYLIVRIMFNGMALYDRQLIRNLVLLHELFRMHVNVTIS